MFHNFLPRDLCGRKKKVYCESKSIAKQKFPIKINENGTAKSGLQLP